MQRCWVRRSTYIVITLCNPLINHERVNLWAHWAHKHIRKLSHGARRALKKTKHPYNRDSSRITLVNYIFKFVGIIANVIIVKDNNHKLLKIKIQVTKEIRIWNTFVPQTRGTRDTVLSYLFFFLFNILNSSYRPDICYYSVHHSLLFDGQRTVHGTMGLV